MVQQAPENTPKVVSQALRRRVSMLAPFDVSRNGNGRIDQNDRVFDALVLLRSDGTSGRANIHRASS
jgi:hypothetical protein